jgi:type I restriction enzyme M protein
MSRKASSKPESSNSTANLGFEAKLWLTADKLRNNMDAAEYSRAERDRLPQAARRVGAGAPVNHVVLGLIFLKYISDTFEEHRAKLLAGQGDYAGANAEDPDEPSGARQPAAGSPKGQRGGAEQYKAENVFWVPADARWSHLQASAKQPEGKAEVRMQKEEPRLQLPTSSFSLQTWPDAMVAIERDNPRLKGVLPKDYARPGLDTARRDSARTPREATPQSLSVAKDNQCLGELIDVIATIELTAASEGEKTHRSVDLLGRVYDWSGATKTAAGSPQGERGGAHQYFLTRFASAEGKNGGQFYTPSCVVRCLVEMLAPYKGRIYDPACGSGGMGEVRNQNYEGRKRPEGAHQTVCAANHPPVRKPAKIHGSSGAGQTTAPLRNIRRRELSGSSSRTEQSRVHREMRRLASRTGRIRLLAGTPRRWRDRASGQTATPSCRVRRTDRHFRHDHQTSEGGRKSEGRMKKEDGFPLLHSSFLLPTFPVLANGSMSSNQSGEGDIRRALIEADLVDCMVALPGQLFYSTQIPVCLWFLAKNKAADAKRGFRDRRQQILVNCDKPAFTNFSNK